ncbi:MAG: class I SAM-dependent methyltransferase [Actinomycetota bacterium]
MASPFDVHAAGYDAVATSAVGKAARARVHAVVDDVLDAVRHSEPVDHGPLRVLDLGCGTGIDAAHLALTHHAEVVAIDASAAMVERAAQRVAAADVEDLVEVHCADVGSAEWSRLVAGPVHLVLANFGVVNMVRDLGRLGRVLCDVVVPGTGRVVLVPMARWCPPELAQAAARANVGLGRRRLVSTADSDYANAPLRYLSGRQLVAALGPGWMAERVEAIGSVLPTMEQHRFVEDRPRLLAGMARLDAAVAGPAARLGVGDHHVVVAAPPAPATQGEGHRA